ncbi:MAG: flavin reductase family protein [Anaerolineae bacterium]|nr:flavin reductase family protein [Anaerolineae bacterium]
MDIKPSDLPHKEMYKLMIGSIVPRPIAWVSTINAEGQPNLAPFSFFTAVCSSPPTILFCPGIRDADAAHKDTLYNVQATGEFVVNIVSEPLAEAMNITATELPAEINEFERAQVTAVPSLTVRPPRVAESLIHYECKLNQIITISDQPGGGNIVIGTVLHLHIDDSVYLEGNKIDLHKLEAIGRLAGPSYCRVNDFFDIHRLPPEIGK